jgi:hypothetical protein
MINEYRGGAEGDRTPDLCSAIAALSHLSYGPKARAFRIWPEVLSRKPLTCDPSGVGRDTPFPPNDFGRAT